MNKKESKINKADYRRTLADTPNKSDKQVRNKNYTRAMLDSLDEQDFAMLFDSDMCMGCKACQVACKQWNKLPSPVWDEDYEFSPGAYSYPPENYGDNYLRMEFIEKEGTINGVDWLFSRVSCHHCTEAGCVLACPTGACHHMPNGSVTISPEICIGCRFCETGCPYHTPKFRYRQKIETKCWFCQDRLEHDGIPACVKMCFPDALDWGYRDEMIRKAHARVDVLREEYPDACVYGEHELGGLHLIEVLKYKPEVYGLPSNPKINIMTRISKLTRPVAALGTIGILSFVGLSYAKNFNYRRAADDLYYDPKTKKTYSKTTGEIWFASEREGLEEGSVAQASVDTSDKVPVSPDMRGED